MALPEFLLTVILVTASGALTPGPLFVAIITHATQTGARGGFAAALGHTLVEFPLILLLAFGLLTIAALPPVQSAIGLIGGAALLGFGALQLLSARRYDTRANPPLPQGPSRGALVLGMTFTAVNPFFLVWWFTIGSKLILDALALAYLSGVLVMYAAHVWMDYAFLTASAHLARRGTRLLGTRRYRWLLASLALILLYFGASFLWTTLTARA